MTEDGHRTSAQERDVRRWLVSGALVTAILLALGLSFGRGLLQDERVAYERGAAVAALYHACRGSFPPDWFVDRAFSRGDPRTCADLRKIDGLPKP